MIAERTVERFVELLLSFHLRLPLRFPLAHDRYLCTISSVPNDVACTLTLIPDELRLASKWCPGRRSSAIARFASESYHSMLSHGGTIRSPDGYAACTDRRSVSSYENTPYQGFLGLHSVNSAIEGPDRPRSMTLPRRLSRIETNFGLFLGQVSSRTQALHVRKKRRLKNTLVFPSNDT